jgi:hypothetical protein
MLTSAPSFAEGGFGQATALAPAPAPSFAAGSFGGGGVLSGGLDAGFGRAPAPAPAPAGGFAAGGFDGGAGFEGNGGFGMGGGMGGGMPGNLGGGMGGYVAAPAPPFTPPFAQPPTAPDAFSSFGGGMGGGIGGNMPGQMGGGTGVDMGSQFGAPMPATAPAPASSVDAKRCAELAVALEIEKQRDHSKLKGWSRDEIRGAKFVLEEQGFTICNVKGDGACFFRCLAVALENDEREHMTYRQDVTKHLISVIDAGGESETEQGANLLYQLMSTSLPLDGDLSTREVIDRYVTYLSLNDEQVDNLGIKLSAKVLEIDIHVHQVDGQIYVHGSSDAVLPNNLEVHVFYDGSHYQYLRRSELGLRPKRPERSHFGVDLRCDRIQQQFDNALRRWSVAIDMFDKALYSLESWKRSQNVRVSTRSTASSNIPIVQPRLPTEPPVTRSETGVHDELGSRAAQASQSTAESSALQALLQAPRKPTWDMALSCSSSQAQPTSGNHVKIYKPRQAGERLSSIYRKPYEYYLRLTVDGSEKVCLQWSGAQELNEDTPLEVLQALSEEDAFAKRSSLTNFWNLLGRPLEKHHFYFVRKCQDECDGVVLLRSMTRQRQQHGRGAPRLTLEVVHVCASGPRGSGALLISALCTVLSELEPNTVLRVNLPGHMAKSRGFWSKLGFNEDGGCSTTMRMHLKDQAWVAYMKSAFPEQLAVDDMVVPSTDIVPSLLEEIWSAEHMKTWQQKDPEYQLLLEDPKAGTTTASSSRTDNIKESVSLISKLDYLGERVSVKGNGSCWLYAVLAGVGLMEHARKCKITSKSQGEHSPTSRDFKVSAMVIQKMKLYATTTKWDITELARTELIQEITNLEAASASRSGTWGGGLDTYGVLSNMLGIQIVWLNLTTPKSFTLFPGGLKGNAKRVSMNALRTTIDGLVAANLKFVVVEYDGIGHFAGYLPRRPMRLSLDVMNFLGFFDS